MKIDEIHIKPVKKGTTLTKKSTRLIKDFGPEGDAYGGPGDRQITLLGSLDLVELSEDKESGLCIDRFIPNITVSGSSSDLIKNRTYRIGDAEILISEISKKCHEGCALREEQKRICLLPKAARFASVLKSGTANIGDDIVERIPSL